MATPKITNRFAIDSDDDEITVSHNQPSVGKLPPLQGAWQRKVVAGKTAAPAPDVKPSKNIHKRIKEVELQLAEVREDMDDTSASTSANWADMCDADDEAALKLKEEVLIAQLERLRRKL